MKSIKEHLGSGEFLRFRLGIGRPKHGSVQSWVLGRFHPEEEAILPVILDKAAEFLGRKLDEKDRTLSLPETLTVYSP